MDMTEVGAGAMWQQEFWPARPELRVRVPLPASIHLLPEHEPSTPHTGVGIYNTELSGGVPDVLTPEWVMRKYCGSCLDPGVGHAEVCWLLQPCVLIPACHVWTYRIRSFYVLLYYT